MPKNKSVKRNHRNLFLMIFILVLIVFGAVGYYSVLVYQDTEAESEGIVICEGDVCEKSLHVHADIDIKACGKEIKVAKNKGKVTQQHTHSEKNKIHYHNRLRVDPITELPLDPTPLKLVNFFENIEITFTPTQIEKYTNGDSCPNGGPGSVKMYVNGVENLELGEYKWKDKDKIEIRFE
jgi:hypothetical protein